jgi:uncharacterized surface protein with fasciclin (FAS1) repeats
MIKLTLSVLILLGTISSLYLLATRQPYRLISNIQKTLNNDNQRTVQAQAQYQTPTPTTSPTPTPNLYDTLNSQGDLTLFTQAINSANLRDTLSSNNSPYTIFAPTDNAVNTFYTVGDPGSHLPLSNLIRYSIISGDQNASNLIAQGNAQTLNGQSLIFNGGPQRLTVNHFLVLRTIPTANGTIYVIPWVLVPSTIVSSDSQNVYSYQDQTQNHYISPITPQNQYMPNKQYIKKTPTPRPTNYPSNFNPDCRVQLSPQVQQYPQP